MPTPSKKPESALEPEPGTIVWVRRRNGSWWPGRIICKKELIASNVMSPRSGTPVKLLGREDASVDWYNIEKSKRVKAFRCGEFDECIRKAEAMAGMHSKRREKYARREDAIVDALELEKEHGDHMKGVNGVAAPPPVKRPKLKGKQKSADADQVKDEAEDSGAYRKYPRKYQPKAKAGKEHEARDLEHGPPSLPRMRGLQDLVSGGASSGQVAVDGGSSEASLLENSGEPAQGKSTKRKRSAGKSGEDAPVKRRDKKRPILQVIETLERDTDERTAAEEKENQVAVKREAPCEGEDKLSEECESTQETLNMVPPQGSGRNMAHVLDAQSSSKHLMTSALQQPAVAGEGTLHQSTSTSAPAHQQRRKTGTGEASKSKKSKTKLASSVTVVGKPVKGKTDDNSTVSRLDASTNSICRNKGKQHQQQQEPQQAAGKTEADETVTACCPSLKSDGQKLGHTGPLHPKTRFEKQPVPMISLASVKNKKPVDGYPVAVEVLPESSKRKKSRNQNGAPPASWQTAKRTARQRTPRSEISPTLELQQQQTHQQQQQQNKKQGKEALSKKLLKKAVLTSKKIRTLASISEKQQPEVNVMLKAAPRWPVPTVIPVSVAMNRLRAVECSLVSVGFMACPSSLVAPQPAFWRWPRREPRTRTSSSQSQMLARAAAAEVPSSSSSGSVSRKPGRLWTGARQGARSLWEETQEWGLGAEPIFRVLVHSDGRLSVEVDEEEICGRCSLQSVVSRRRIVAAERIAKARKLAADIENGLLLPPPTSSVFRYVKDGHRKQATLVGNARVFLQQKGWTIGGGLLVGLAIALASFLVLQMRSRLDEQSRPPKSPPSSRPVHNTERLLAIRGMARQAMDEEEAAGELEEMDESMRYGAAMRAKIAKKGTDQEASDDPEITRLDGSSPNTMVAQTAEPEVRPRIILSTKEAAELLAERRRQSLKKQPAPTVPGEDVNGAVKADLESTASASHHSYQRPKSPALEETPLVSSFVSDKHVDLASGRQQEDMKQEHTDQSNKFAPENKQEVSGSQALENIFMGTFEQVAQKPQDQNSVKQEHSVVGHESLEQKLGLQANEDVSTGTLNDSRKLLRCLEKQQQGTRLDERSPSREAQEAGHLMEHTAAPETIPLELKLQNGSFEAAEISHCLNNGPTENSAVEVESADRELISGWSFDEEAAVGTNQAAESGHCLNDVPTENSANSLGEAGSEDRELTIAAPNSAVAASAVREFLSKEKRDFNESGEKLSRTVIACNADLPVNQEPENPKKVWPKELQRRYERETDPRMRALMKEIGKDLKEWIPEEKVEEAISLFSKGPDGQREFIRRWQREIARQKGRKVTELEEKQLEKMLNRCAKIEERMQNWTNRFGPLALRNKYRDYIPRKPDYNWWFDLRYVACLNVRNEKHSADGGLYSMDMADEDKQQKGRVHVIGFEEQHDALNFSQILVPEMDELYGETDVSIIPFEPKELFREAAAAGYRVTVIKKGELQMFAGQALYEVEDKIRFIGRDYYLQEEIRARSIDIAAVMEDIGRGL